MSKARPLLLGFGVVVATAAAVVIIGRDADRESAAECRGDRPRRGDWSEASDGSEGLRVFRSTCAQCHGFTDDGAFCLRKDGDRLRGPVDPLTETTRHDRAAIASIVRAHQVVVDGGASLIATLTPADLDAVAAFVAEIR